MSKAKPEEIIPHESKAEKFRRLGERRVTMILDGVRKLGTLSDRNRYEFSPNQIGAIFEELSSALEACEERFNEKPKAKTQKFILPLAEEEEAIEGETLMTTFPTRRLED